MFLKSVTIRGFRAAAQHDITCTLPGRFTLLVGGNNAGNDTGSTSWDGAIDELAIYPTALTDARIAAHHHAAQP